MFKHCFVFGISLLNILGIVALGLMFSAIFVPVINGSEGEHTGIVTAVEENDNLVWDANLVYFKTDAESTQEDVYCVNDDYLKEKLELLSKSREVTTIEFQHDKFLWSSECNGGISIITGITEHVYVMEETQP